jgi:hypothetical protein
MIEVRSPDGDTRSLPPGLRSVVQAQHVLHNAGVAPVKLTTITHGHFIEHVTLAAGEEHEVVETSTVVLGQ